MRKNGKKIVGVIVLVALALVVVFGCIPAVRNATITKWFSHDNGTETTAPADTTADTTEADVPVEDTTPSEEEAPNEDNNKVLTVEEFFKLALTDDGKLKVPAQGTQIFDITDDEYVEAGTKLAVNLMVNPYGAVAVEQAGFDNKPAHEGEVNHAFFQLCDCDEVAHATSWNPSMGQFGWSVAEGNNALGPKSWSRMMGNTIEVLLSVEEQALLMEAACYWYDTDGVKQYGFRICGDQHDPEAYEVVFKFVSGTTSKELPSEVLTLVPASVLVMEGTEVAAPVLSATTVAVSGGTWSFTGWEPTSVLVDGPETITGTWVFTADAKPQPAPDTTPEPTPQPQPEPAPTPQPEPAPDTTPEPTPQPQPEKYTVSYTFVAANGTLPAEVKGLIPSTKRVEAGTTVTSPSVTKTVKVTGGTWTFAGWSQNSVKVTGNVTVIGTWTYKADEQQKQEEKPVVKNYMVKFSFRSVDGQTLPNAVTRYLPSAYAAAEGSVAKAPSLAVTEVRVSNGTWKFRYWTATSITVDGNESFVGVWKFVEDLTLAPVEDQGNTPEHSPETEEEEENTPSHTPYGEGTESSNVTTTHPDATNQDELNKLVPREELQEQPSASKAEDSNKPGLSLAPVQ